jgi:hypothetical protein
MKRLERRGAFYVACMAVLVVVMLLILLERAVLDCLGCCSKAIQTPIWNES